MSNERRLRLHQVAREFKVGINTITDFLEKKGVSIESSPSTLIEPDVYAILDKEFGANRGTDPRSDVRERISQKQTSVSLDRKKGDDGFKDEVVIKSKGVFSIKDEVRTSGPKIIGKIDLSDNRGKGSKPEEPATSFVKKETAEHVEPRQEKPAAESVPAAAAEAAEPARASEEKSSAAAAPEKPQSAPAA